MISKIVSHTLTRQRATAQCLLQCCCLQAAQSAVRRGRKRNRLPMLSLPLTLRPPASSPSSFSPPFSGECHAASNRALVARAIRLLPPSTPNPPAPKIDRGMRNRLWCLVRAPFPSASRSAAGIARLRTRSRRTARRAHVAARRPATGAGDNAAAEPDSTSPTTAVAFC